MAGTYFHEAFHAWLANTTMLGMLQSVMIIESIMAEGIDECYSRKCDQCAMLLTERTRFVHEIYANNMELLSLEKNFDHEEMLRALKNRTQEYQAFYSELSPIHNSGLSIQEKIEHVNTLCEYAMNIHIPKATAVDFKALSAYLKGDNDPYQRLKKAISDYQKNGFLPKKNIDEEEILHAMKEIAVYSKQYINEGIEKIKKCATTLEGQTAANLLNDSMLGKVCLFDLEMIRPRRVDYSEFGEKNVFLAQKHVQNLLDKENFYLIGHDTTYIVTEANFCGLNKKIDTCLSVCVTMEEYDIKEKCPCEFKTGNALLTIIMQTKEDCEKWLNEERGTGTIYTAELCMMCGGTAVRILFFCKRGQSERIFVFPTLDDIRNDLIEKFDLQQNCLSADDNEFLKLFCYLNNEIDMLKYIQELLSLLLDRAWENIIQSDALSQLAAQCGGNIGNSIMRIKRKDYYKILHALPQKDTLKAPLFMLMRFDKGKNTGDTYADQSTQAPVLFPNKEEAEYFASFHAPEYTGVGVDEVYWPFFRNMIRCLNKKVILMVDVRQNIGKLVNVEDCVIWYR